MKETPNKALVARLSAFGVLGQNRASASTRLCAGGLANLAGFCACERLAASNRLGFPFGPNAHEHRESRIRGVALPATLDFPGFPRWRICHVCGHAPAALVATQARKEKH